MTTTRLTALAAALAFTAAALSPAVAAPRPSAWNGLYPNGFEGSGAFGTPNDRSFAYDNDPATCPMSSAAESNANQQNFPVKQYGQTSGGNRC